MVDPFPWPDRVVKLPRLLSCDIGGVRLAMRFLETLARFPDCPERIMSGRGRRRGFSYVEWGEIQRARKLCDSFFAGCARGRAVQKMRERYWAIMELLLNRLTTGGVSGPFLTHGIVRGS
jgi:hypothetical protein